MKEKILFSFSGGKDSILALYEIQKQNRFQIEALITTISQSDKRVFHNSVRDTMIEKQAMSLGYILEKIYLSENNNAYEQQMRNLLKKYISKGVKKIAFGDIFLEDLRSYRQNKLAQVGMEAVFPLWIQKQEKIADRFINLGFRGIITSIDSNILNKSFLGRDFEMSFLADLPAEIDKCGEQGQFHTFVYDGPNFKERIRFEKGKIFENHKRFYYCDIIPVEEYLPV